MIFYDMYATVPAVEQRGFVERTEVGRLVTVGADAMPHIGLYPFTFEATAIGPVHRIDLHLHRDDEQIADLRRSPRCGFAIDDILATIPSHWLDPDHAAFATAYHRSTTFECVATVIDDGPALAEQQNGLMRRYQPEGGYAVVDVDDRRYAGMLGMLVAVRLDVEVVRVKHKLGQNRTPDQRRVVADRLRERGRHDDGRAADALLATLDWPTA